MTLHVCAVSYVNILITTFHNIASMRGNDLDSFSYDRSVIGIAIYTLCQ